MRAILTLALAASVAAAAAGCAGTADEPEDGAPRIVVTTSILGDVVAEVVGPAADVQVVMPRGADPHEFAPSARQAERMAGADLVVANGAGFEPGLEDAIAAAPRSFVFAEHVDLLGGDPHLWTDPTRMATGVEALGDELDRLGIRHDAGRYAAELAALDTEIERLLAPVPPEDRVLVTNHEVLGYFADRYGFEVVGAVIPSTTTGAQPSAAGVEALAEVIVTYDVPAIFAETTASASIAEALAESVGDVRIVTLHTESLGDEGSGAESYVEMQRTNARRIRDALA